MDKTLEDLAAELTSLNAADPLMSFDDDLTHIASIRNELSNIGEPTSRLKMMEWSLKVMNDLTFKHDQLAAGVDSLNVAKEAANRAIDNISSWNGGTAAQREDT